MGTQHSQDDAAQLEQTLKHIRNVTHRVKTINTAAARSTSRRRTQTRPPWPARTPKTPSTTTRKRTPNAQRAPAQDLTAGAITLANPVHLRTYRRPPHPHKPRGSSPSSSYTKEHTTPRPSPHQPRTATPIPQTTTPDSTDDQHAPPQLHPSLNKVGKLPRHARSAKANRTVVATMAAVSRSGFAPAVPAPPVPPTTRSPAPVTSERSAATRQQWIVFTSTSGCARAWMVRMNRSKLLLR